jgi:hypothetical protein
MTMRVVSTACLAFASVLAAGAVQGPIPPIEDTRLTVHTLVREDIFAGFMGDNLARLERAERNIDQLLTNRPGERANLLAWKAGATTYRAVRAHEAGNAAEFDRLFAQARAGFAEAAGLTSGNDGVAAITGGTMAVFGDRFPDAHQAVAWSLAYDNYSLLWKQQGANIEKMPVHFKGEVLAGLTQSAQRTGRADEVSAHLDRMLTLLAGTRYEPVAQQWKADPSSAATSNLTCKNCHNPGRLAARLEALAKGQ